jgi:hypothetical protein
MPTPRNITQVAAQGGASAPQTTAQQKPRPGAWVEATIASTTSDLSDQYEVDIAGDGSVSIGRKPATLAVDAALRIGDRVWVVDTGSGWVIAGER